MKAIDGSPVRPQKASILRLPTAYAPPDGYVTAAEVASTVPGVSYRQIHYWTSLNYLRAAAGPDGSGHQIVFDPAEVQVVRIMAALVGDGLHPRVAARVARELHEFGHSAIAGIRLDLPEIL